MSEELKISGSFTEEVINDRLSICRFESISGSNSFSEDIRCGLKHVPKVLHPKYFYDNIGSELFEKICDTPEYYVTRTESSILDKYSDEMALMNKGKKVIVELGSGSSVKTRYILSSFIKSEGCITYLPIDVSEIMVQSSKELLSEFEGLNIRGINGEYEEGIEIINELTSEPKIIIFLGSSIGNFTPVEAKRLLSSISNTMSGDDSFLMGFDMVKDENVLNSAYDDSAGITAEFNLNILQRINTELGGTFDLSKFSHKAFFNKAMSRIEMHLVSGSNQTVYIDKLNEYVEFRKGETIHTENSYKFTDEMINDLAGSAGLKVNKTWKDDRNYFGLCLMSK